MSVFGTERLNDKCNHSAEKVFCFAHGPACLFFFFFLQDLFSISAYVHAQKPQLDIHSFEGNFTRVRKCYYTHTHKHRGKNIYIKNECTNNPLTIIKAFFQTLVVGLL